MFRIRILSAGKLDGKISGKNGYFLIKLPGGFFLIIDDIKKPFILKNKKLILQIINEVKAYSNRISACYVCKKEMDPLLEKLLKNENIDVKKEIDNNIDDEDEIKDLLMPLLESSPEELIKELLIFFQERAIAEIFIPNFLLGRSEGNNGNIFLELCSKFATITEEGQNNILILFSNIFNSKHIAQKTKEKLLLSKNTSYENFLSCILQNFIDTKMEIIQQHLVQLLGFLETLPSSTKQRELLTNKSFSRKISILDIFAIKNDEGKYCFNEETFNAALSKILKILKSKTTFAIYPSFPTEESFWQRATIISKEGKKSRILLLAIYFKLFAQKTPKTRARKPTASFFQPAPLLIGDFNVSGHELNCGLYAVALGVAEEHNKIKDNSEINNYTETYNWLSENITRELVGSTSLDTEKLTAVGLELRGLLKYALIHNKPYKERCLESFFQLCLTDNIAASAVDQASSFYQSNHLIIQSIREEINELIKSMTIIDSLKPVDGKNDEALTSLRKRKRAEETDDETTAIPPAKIQKINTMLDISSQKLNILSELNALFRAEVSNKFDSLGLLLINYRECAVAKENYNEFIRHLADVLSGYLQAWNILDASTMTENELQEIPEIMKRWLFETLFQQLNKVEKPALYDLLSQFGNMLAEINFESFTSDKVQNAANLYTRFLVKEYSELMYENYCAFVGSQNVMTTADELAIFAESLNASLVIKFPNGILSKPLGATAGNFCVILSNPTETHWQLSRNSDPIITSPLTSYSR